MFVRNSVQILFCRKDASRKEVLIPAAAEYPLSLRNLPVSDKMSDSPAHFFTGKAVFQICISQRIAVAHQVSMRVVETWNDSAPAQIDDLGKLSFPAFYFLVGAYFCDPVSCDGCSFCDAAVHGIDPGIF